MRTQVAIVGGGLAGLYAARLLHAAKTEGRLLSDAEKKIVFEAHFRHEQQTIVGETVRNAAAVVTAARDAGVLVSAVGPRTVRLVTHLDVSAEQARDAAVVLGKVLAEVR